MLFQGASCQLTDDWKLEQKRLERQAAATQNTEAKQAKQEVQRRCGLNHTLKFVACVFHVEA